VEREDLEKFNALLDKLTDNKFFEYYGELGDYFQYLAHKYKFDSKSHTVDPATGEIVSINNKDNFYFGRGQKLNFTFEESVFDWI